MKEPASKMNLVESEEYIIVCSYNGVLYSNTKEHTTDALKNANKISKNMYAYWKKPGAEIDTMFIFLWSSKADSTNL